MNSLNKLIGSAIQHFGHGLQTGGCHSAVEETNQYLADLQQTAADLNLLQHEITEQREAITLLMRHEGLIHQKETPTSPVSAKEVSGSCAARSTAKIIPLHQE